MAYEPPAHVDFSSGFIIRGRKALDEYRQWRRNFVRVRADLREAFPNERSVNDALELVLTFQRIMAAGGKKRKTA